MARFGGAVEALLVAAFDDARWGDAFRAIDEFCGLNGGQFTALAGDDRFRAAVAALARRDGIRIVPDGATAAHRLGLTSAVPARAGYVTDSVARTVAVDARTIRFRHAGPRVMRWAGRPGLAVVQAPR